METQSTSNGRSQQLIISQAVTAIQRHRMEEILHSVSIFDIQEFVTTLYQEHYQFENLEASYKKIRYHSFNKLKKRWVQAAIGG